MTTEAVFVYAPPPPPATPRADAAPEPQPAPEAAPTTLPPGAIARLELLLRDPRGFLSALEHAETSPDAGAIVASLTRVLLAALVVGQGLFGAVVGAHRGGMQVLSCAVKVPLILLVTLVVCAAPFVTLARAAGLPLGARQVIVLALAACSRFALVLVGLAPFVWLMEGWSLGYHRVIVSVVAVCAVSGVAAGRLLFAGLSRHGETGTRVGLAFVAVFALVGAQTSWILRPYVVRPRSAGVPFVRGLEGDFLGAVGNTTRSAVGVYSAQSDRAYREYLQSADAGCRGPSCD